MTGDAEATLQSVARAFASILPAADNTARHERWDPDLGPLKKSANSICSWTLSIPTKQG